MQGVLEIAEVAALVGDPTRANILCALLDGRALTASELAYSAGVSPQTTSGHLAKLTNGKLLGLVKQGRHHYYRLAGPHIGRMLESIMDVAVTGPPRYRPRSSREEQLRRARTCYDHLAGQIGVGLARAQAGRRFFCRPCLDWTERRPHIGGAVGAALATRCFDLGWVARRRNSRGLDITPIGRKGLLEVFDLSI